MLLPGLRQPLRLPKPLPLSIVLLRLRSRKRRQGLPGSGVGSVCELPPVDRCPEACDVWRKSRRLCGSQPNPAAWANWRTRFRRNFHARLVTTRGRARSELAGCAICDCAATRCPLPLAQGWPTDRATLNEAPASGPLQQHARKRARHVLNQCGHHERRDANMTSNDCATTAGRVQPRTPPVDRQ